MFLLSPDGRSVFLNPVYGYKHAEGATSLSIYHKNSDIGTFFSFMDSDGRVCRMFALGKEETKTLLLSTEHSSGNGRTSF